MWNQAINKILLRCIIEISKLDYAGRHHSQFSFVTSPNNTFVSRCCRDMELLSALLTIFNGNPPDSSHRATIFFIILNTETAHVNGTLSPGHAGIKESFVIYSTTQETTMRKTMVLTCIYPGIFRFEQQTGWYSKLCSVRFNISYKRLSSHMFVCLYACLHVRVCLKMF